MKVPPRFYLSFPLCVDAPSVSAAWSVSRCRQLASRKLKGIKGVGGQWSMHSFNEGGEMPFPSAVLVMDGPKLKHLNKLKPVNYLDADNLLSDGLAAVYRVWDNDPPDNLVLRAIRSVNLVTREWGFSSREPHLHWALNSLLEQIHLELEDDPGRVKPPRSWSAKSLASWALRIGKGLMDSGRWSLVGNELRDFTGLTVGRLADLISKAVVNHVSSFFTEEEWLVKSPYLHVPKQSKLGIVFSGRGAGGSPHRGKIDHYARARDDKVQARRARMGKPPSVPRRRPVGRSLSKDLDGGRAGSPLSREQAVALVREFGLDKQYRVSLISSRKFKPVTERMMRTLTKRMQQQRKALGESASFVGFSLPPGLLIDRSNDDC